jgi:hypothetical protein
MAEVAEKKVEVEINWAEVFAKAKEYHVRKMGNRLENASTTHIDERGKIGYSHGGNVCHNHMHNDGFKFVINGLQIGTAYTCTMGRPLSKEVELWFVDYILNRSPYSETFVSKDAAECLQEQMTISSGDHPSNLLVAGLVALRRLWEYTTVVSVAYSLVQHGVNEDLAFVLGHLAQVVEDPKPTSILQWTACKAGHCSLNPAWMDFKVLKNFLEHSPKKLNPLWSAGHGDYHGYDEMYGKAVDHRNNIYEYVKKNFPYDLYSGKPAVFNTNPFAASLPKANEGKGKGAQYDKAISVMAEWAKTHLMEKINDA